MPSLLLVVFVLQLVLHIFNSIGVNTLNNLLWILYNKFPTKTSKAANEAPKVKREVVRLKRELNQVSAQDDFAKWAKLRRQHDKVMAEFEKLDATLRTHQTSFNSLVSTLRWTSTNGLRLFLQFWYSKQPMFWIPQGWVPGYVEWILSFPRSPKGSVSINIWCIACASVIALVAEAVTAIYVLVTHKVPQTGEKKPMAFEAEGADSEKAKAEEKKGL